MRNIFISLIGSLFVCSGVAFGATAVTCTPAAVKFQNKNAILPGVEQVRTTKIYFLHNTSEKSLWLDHPNKGEGSAKAGWSSFFQPGKWSAILLNRKDFALSCAVINPGKVDFQNCEKVMSVCSPEKIKFDSKRKGSYWLVEDKAWDEMLIALEKRGVELPERAVVKTDAVKSTKAKN